MMKQILIDTNVIIRLFDTISDPKQTDKAKFIFREAQNGNLLLIVAPPVLFEVAWVLRSSLKWSNNEVLDVLEAIISWPGVKVIDKEYVKTALSLGRSHNNGFADSYLAAIAKDNRFEVATFDENHFKKLDVVLFHF
jgi:predicted nucleic acid-binding protein